MSSQWRDVANYEGLYQVSDAGEVRRFKRGTYRNRKLKPNNRGIELTSPTDQSGDK